MSTRNVATFSEDQLYDFVLAKVHSAANGQEIAEVLKSQAIAGEQFLELDDSDIKELFEKVGHRKDVQKLLKSCKPQDTSGRPVPPVQLDQSPPPYPTAHSLPPIEQLSIMMTNSATLVKACKQIEVGPPAVFKLIPKHWKDIEKHKIASCIVGEETSYTIRSLHKVIVVVGATGCGKSTIINALANYMLGVTFSDPHRYQLITQADEGGHSQAHSQTSWVKAYTFPKQPGSRIPYALTIVDTPGYGDTRGMHRDISITEQIKFFFECKEIGVDHINAIAFVVKASDARLTPSQKYIFNSILAVFAKDTEPGMMIVATHADGKDIKAKQALKEASVPVQEKLTFGVNNSALYAPNVTGVEPDDDFVLQNKITWNRNEKVYRIMYDAVGQMHSISLWQTQENLRERDNFRLILESIGPQIQVGVANAASIKKMREVIKQHQTEIDENKDFAVVMTHTVPKSELVELESTWAFNCKTCKKTCHYPCTAFFNRMCDVMAFWKNKCSICEKCKAAQHKCEKYRYETKMVEMQQVINEEQLKKKCGNYCVAEIDMSRSKAALNALLQKQNKIWLDNRVLIRQAKHCAQRIQEISLNPNPALAEGEYIDIVIEIEEKERKEGWEERVKSLKQLKHFAKVTSKLDKLEEKDVVAFMKELKSSISEFFM